MTTLDLFLPAPQPPIAMEKAAVISDCGRYRYRLTRRWNVAQAMLPVCMLNPSTADHENDDPTIRALIHFAAGWGYGGLVIVNLMAFRASHPKAMMAAADPFGPDNDRHLRSTFADARHTNTPMLVAWGNDGGFMDRNIRFCQQAQHHLVRMVCLGTTLAGHPKHPMARGTHRIPRDQIPIPFGQINPEAPR